MAVPGKSSLCLPAQRIFKWVGGLLATAILTAALYLFLERVNGLRLSHILDSAMKVSPQRLWACGIMAAISFIALGGYDAIAVRVLAPGKVSILRACFVGVIANAISNTLGFHALTATWVRYRMLRSHLTKAQVAGVTALSWLALAIGFASIFSLTLLASPASSVWNRLAGLILLGLLLLGASWLGPGRRITLKGMNVQ